ncbi:MAG: epoxide hydrolase [Hahellaceae bacterium]|nr:epoxide hydrolase [Hahellaceae bacterium]
MQDIRPFKLAIPGSELEDLCERLGKTRWPDNETVGDWSQGVPLSYMKVLCQYWSNTYDWRRCERLLNSYAQFITRIDDLDIHFLHVKSSVQHARPLLLTHGWPGSIVELLKVIEPLAEPGTDGTPSVDAFHLIVPSLPGYGFSAKPQDTGWGVKQIANAWNKLMSRLGYDQYFAHGGDWGAVITTEIAAQNQGNCKAIHLTLAIVEPDPATMNSLTIEETEYLVRAQSYLRHDSGYAKIQGTRPQTIGYGICDSPAGQAAWIVDKFWSWTDCHGHPENAISRDELLDNVMMYWLTGAGASSARLYWESLHTPDYDEVHIPAGFSHFPKEIMFPSRRWAESRFKNINFWTSHDRGGHFPAMEVPALLIDDIRSCFRDVTL